MIRRIQLVGNCNRIIVDTRGFHEGSFFVHSKTIIVKKIQALDIAAVDAAFSDCIHQGHGVAIGFSLEGAGYQGVIIIVLIESHTTVDTVSHLRIFQVHCIPISSQEGQAIRICCIRIGAIVIHNPVVSAINLRGYG